MSEQDRDKEIRGMAQCYGVADKLQGTTTLKNKQGLGHFTILHMWDKHARSTFLRNVKNDPHKIKGNTIAGRPQIPRYRREQDAPMKCAMKALATIYGGNPKFRPTWELQALWHESEWVLAVATDANDATKVTIFVPDDKREEFETQFAEDWPTWQSRGHQTEGSPQKYLCINIAAFTDDNLQELNERYATMSTRSRSSRTSDDVDMANADEEVGSRTPPPKAEESARRELYIAARIPCAVQPQTVTNIHLAHNAQIRPLLARPLLTHTCQCAAQQASRAHRDL